MKRSWRAWRALGLSVFAVWACTEKPATQPRNQCKSDAECDTGSRCEEARGLCIADRVDEPYVVTIQVATQGSQDSRARRHTFSSFSLTQSELALDLSIPRGDTMAGFIGANRESEMQPVAAQLSFTPMTDEEGLPVAAVTTMSRDNLDEGASNVKVTLTSNTRYAVAIFPIGKWSLAFPPASFVLDTDSADTFSFVYPALDTFRGRVIDQAGTPLEGRAVRIIDTKNRNVLSSTGIVGEAGELELQVLPDVLAGGSYRFEVDLEPKNAWETVIEVDPLRVDAENQNTIALPVVPRFVRFRGIVEKSADVRLSSADLTFVSDFPIPNVPGEVGDRDFCRSALPKDPLPPFTCRSVRRGTTGEDGRFMVTLLPGDYRVFLSPTSGEEVNRAATQPDTAVIETQAADGPQQGQAYMLKTGSRYEGSVLSTEGEPLSNVLVRAVALGVARYLPEVATYNRASETVTGKDGRFMLPVDLGFYDLVARPAASSGYPWRYVPDQAVNVPNAVLKVGGFVMRTPVLLAGTVDSDGVPEVGADVDAFALVPGESGRRSVLIAQTTTDAQGHYALLLAPTIMPPRTPQPEGGAE